MRARSISTVARFVAICVVVLVAGFVVRGGSGATPAAAQADAEKPNIVFIVTDDLDKASLERMPNIKRLIADRGATFDNYYVSEAVCCPSRSTYLTGEYVHNHHVGGNNPPNGGYQRFLPEGHEQRTIAARLQPSGYTNGLFGKYLNGYGPESNSQTHVPPYWDRWFAKFNLQRYDWDANDDGTVVHYGTKPQHYSDDVIAKKARAWITRRASREPFFAYVAPYAPHGPYVDPPAHTTEFAGERAPRNPNFNETDVSDKPGYVSGRPLLTAADEAGIDQRYVSRLRMMLAVDDMVKGIVADLRAAGELDNTYIFVTSDNGWMQGEHRFSGGKGKPYEEASEMPLLVRGPGITPGIRISELAVNTDLYETFSDIAGVPEDRDGRSLLPLLHDDASSWRNQILLENLSGDGGEEPGDGGEPDDGGVPDYYGIRTDRYKYIEYSTGEKELYDLDHDPYELDNIHATADRALLSDLKAKLNALKSCSGQTCREAEDTR